MLSSSVLSELLLSKYYIQLSETRASAALKSRTTTKSAVEVLEVYYSLTHFDLRRGKCCLHSAPLGSKLCISISHLHTLRCGSRRICCFGSTLPQKLFWRIQSKAGWASPAPSFRLYLEHGVLSIPLWVQVIVRPHCQIYGSAALCSHPETYKRRGNHRYLTALQQCEAVTPTTRSRLRLKLRAFIICNYQANYIKTGFGVSYPSGSMSRRVSCRLESSSPVFELQSLGWVLRR